MKYLAIFIPLCFLAAETLESFRALPVVTLEGDTHHVQGIDVDRSNLWLTSVDQPGKRGFLFIYDRRNGTRIRSAEVQTGAQYHPGGISREGESIWVPVAEYRRSSTARIQKRNAKTLELESEFVVKDHIGAIAVVPEGLAGANWDAREFYVWDKSGKLLRKFANPTEVAIQDMKFSDGKLVAGGLQKGNGVVIWFEWPTAKVLRRIDAGKTDRGVAFTHEGLAIVGTTLYVLPEDSRSRLFSFELPQ